MALARVFDDRDTARDLFNRPELAWFAEAEKKVWPRQQYDEARVWASDSPSIPKSMTAPTPGSMPSGTAAAPAAVAEPPKRRTPGIMKFPPLILESVQSYKFEELQVTAAFLIETPSGLKAISAVSVAPAGDNFNIVEAANRKLVSWTVRSPLNSDRTIPVKMIDTVSKNGYQAGRLALPGIVRRHASGGASEDLHRPTIGVRFHRRLPVGE